MMRVCFAVDAPFLGGAEYYVSRLALGLKDRGFEAALLVDASRGASDLEGWIDSLAAEGVRVLRAPMRLPRHPGDALRVWRAFETAGADVVHVNMPGPYSGQNGLLVPLARASGARVVVTEHLPMVARNWKRAVVKWGAYRLLDVAITMTDANAALLRNQQGVPARKVRVVRNGLPLAFGRSLSSERTLGREVVTIAFVGNILPHKGLHRALQVLSMVEGRWRLRVVGSGPDEPRCRQQAAVPELRDRVEFLGSQPPGRIEGILQDSDMLVLPSEIEGLPYTILEAMACSLPVVAGDVFGVGEAVSNGHTGILVDPTDVNALGSAIARLVDDAHLRARMGSAGRQRFESHFTFEQQLATTAGIYASLLAGKGKRWP